MTDRSYKEFGLILHIEKIFKREVLIEKLVIIVRNHQESEESVKYIMCIYVVQRTV